jgi:hypothetical protein
MSDIINSKLVNAKRAADHVGFTYSMFRTGVAAGLFPFYRIGKSRLFRLGEVEAALQAHRVAPVAEVLS